MTGPDETTHEPTREEKLERALNSGVTELPPNRVRGLLGQASPDLRKPENFEPDLNSGVSQENDLPVLWMAIVLSYLLVFPVAYVLLWRSKLISRRAKFVVSAVGAIGLFYVALRLLVG